MSRPFVSASHALKSNHLVHGWSDLLELLRPGSGVCLDLGAGDGGHRDRIEAKGWSWVGIDMVLCQCLSAVADAQRLPFATDSVDLVFTNQVLEHLPRPWVAAKEVLRVLPPGGRFFGSASFLEPFHDSYYAFSHWAIEELLTDAGFEIVEIRPGTSVFVTVAKAMTPDTRAGPLIGKWAGRLSMGLLRVAGWLWAMRHGKASQQWQQYERFWVKAPLRFSGHIMFVAQKPALSGSGP